LRSDVTVDEVARLAGEEPDRIRHWQQLGLLRSGDELDVDDLERARLVVFAARQGVEPEELSRICQEQGDMLETFVRWSARPSGTVFTRQEIAERSGLDES